MIISGRFQGCKNRISLLGMILIFGVKQPLQINLSVRPRIRLPVRYNSLLAERVSLPGPRVFFPRLTRKKVPLWSQA